MDDIQDIPHFIASLVRELGLLREELSFLQQENASLRERLSKYESPFKDSHNSSIPPSKESISSREIRRTRSLREPSNRPSGGQPGHKGSTLLMNDSPDQTSLHSPEYCTCCGGSLDQIEGEVSETRQSIDIPLPVKAITTNHISIKKTCSCGHCTKGDFPVCVKPGVSYGVNIHALVAYLSVVQHIPFKRLTDILKDFYGVEISQGSVSNILNRMRTQSKPGYDAIKKQIEQSKVVGADETGEHLNGKLHWMWVFQNRVATYIFQHPSRGKAAIDAHFPEGLPKSILVTDRHRSYFNIETDGHQICLAHLLRELTYLEESDKNQDWASRMLELLRESIHRRKTLPISEIDVGDIKGRFTVLLEEDLSKLNKEFGSLQKSLIKHSEYLFQFLSHPDIPYDNNTSERAIRPLKVKQKVSGGFRSDDGAEAFCQLHSIVDTARKNKQEPFIALIAVAENRTN